MATSSSFAQLLNDYLPVGLLREEYQRTDFLMSHLSRDDSWAGSVMQVPFLSGLEAARVNGEVRIREAAPESALETVA